MRGLTRYAIEPLPEDTITKNALSRISDGKWYSDDSLWIKEDAESIDNLKLLFELVDGDEFERHKLRRQNDVNVLAQCDTMQKLFLLCKDELQPTERDILLKHDIGVDAAITIVDEKFRLSMWCKTTKTGLLMHFPYILVAWNLTVYEIKLKGAGVKDDGVHRWNDFETIFKHDGLENKFNMRAIDINDIQDNTRLPETTAMQPSFESQRWGVLEVAPELITTNKIVEVTTTAAGEIGYAEKHLDEVKNVKVIVTGTHLINYQIM
jgi:hypothetical protein